MGGTAHPYNCNTEHTSPLRVFDSFNSKAKTMAAFTFCEIKNAKLKVARFLPSKDQEEEVYVQNEKWRKKKMQNRKS